MDSKQLDRAVSPGQDRDSKIEFLIPGVHKMSCKHVASGYHHTWSIGHPDNPGAILHCVLCIHEMFSHLPTTNVPLRLLDANRDLTYYWDEDIEGHIERVNTADLGYPIFITYKMKIIDGCHRVVKARSLGLDTITAIVLTDEELTACEIRG